MMILTPSRFIGLSVDTKPTSAGKGSTFYEADTRNTYTCFDGVQWVLSATSADSSNVKNIVNLNQAAGAKTAFTATAQNVFIDYVGLYIPVDVSGVETFTGISVQSTDDTPVVFISSTAGAKANLTAGKLLAYPGPAVVASTKLITLTIIGGATGVACNSVLFVAFRPVVAGGYLAVA